MLNLFGRHHCTLPAFFSCGVAYLCPDVRGTVPFVCLPTALLEIIMKNGSTAGNSTHCRKPPGGGDQSKPTCTKDGTPSSGEGGKVYTKDQVDGVLR